MSCSRRSIYYARRAGRAKSSCFYRLVYEGRKLLARHYILCKKYIINQALGALCDMTESSHRAVEMISRYRGSWRAGLSARSTCAGSPRISWP